MHEVPLLVAAREQHNALPTAVAVRHIAGLKALASSGDAMISVGTACSGSEVIIPASHALFKFFEEEYGVKICLKHTFASENDREVQKHIASNFPDVTLFTDNLHLCLPSAPSYQGASARVEHVDIFVAGFICKTSSKLRGAPAQKAVVGLCFSI